MVKLSLDSHRIALANGTKKQPFANDLPTKKINVGNKKSHALKRGFFIHYTTLIRRSLEKHETYQANYIIALFRILSNISTASFCIFPVLCTYLLNVVSIFSCPNRSCTVLGDTPASISIVACVCLNE